MLKYSVTYRLPRYQRGYAWEKKHVEKFFEDLITTQDNRQHFFGTIYIVDSDKILDGQQRITSIFLFIACVRDYLKAKDVPREMINELENYIFTDKKTKLILSKINNNYFQSILKNDSNVEEPHNDEKNDSNTNMYETYLYLRSQVEQHGKKHGVDSVKNLVDKLLDRFTVICVSVTSSSAAYSMFNLINDRGLKLKPSDLIKSYIFGNLEDMELDSKAIENVDEQWNKIIKNLGKTRNFDIDVFIQHVLSITKYVSIKDIFEEISKRLSLDEIMGWVDKTAEWSYVVRNLRTLREFESEPCKTHIERINHLGAVAVYPLLMVGYKKYWETNKKASFNRLTEACLKYHLRTKTIGTVTVEEYQKGLFGIAARFTKEDYKVDDVILNLCNTSAYLSENDLRSLLHAHKPNSTVAKILLQLIEEKADTDKISHTTVTVEHIMPQKPSSAWFDYICTKHDFCSKEEAKTIHKENYKRLGNLTLLNKGENIGLSNKLFLDKRQKFVQSHYQITKQLGRLDKWTQPQIDRRQKEFVSQLVRILDIEA